MILETLVFATVLHGTLAGIMMDPGVMVQAITGPPPPRDLTPTELALNQLCSQKCTVEKCFLRDTEDCGNYIMCEKAAKGFVYRGLKLPCAFGTYWAGLATQQKITCDLPQNVVCNIRPCDTMPVGYKYATEWNCKAYWECGASGPEPKCCGGDMYSYFDSSVGDCVYDKLRQPCLHTCPIKTDACSIPGTLTAYFPDNNCRTYWDCEDRRPHPVCCAPGQSYDETLKVCNPDLQCNDACPTEYEPDICNRQDNYTLHDNHCRTFMRCNHISGDERWCCMHGDFYDPLDNTCKPKVPGQTYACADECPDGYSVECHLWPIPNAPELYSVLVNDVSYTMSCAPGTAFRQDMCTCGSRLLDAVDNSCNMELQILFDFPNWIRSGSQKFTHIEISNKDLQKAGTILNNKKAFRFEGTMYYRMSFFQQAMPELFIHMVFLPGRTNSGGKQALISNCLALEGGTPSVELALQNGQITLSLVASSQQNSNVGNIPVTLTVPYGVEDWNELTILYDGQTVSMYNDGPQRGYDSKPMTGEIKVAAEGLDVAGCTGQTLMYQGDIAKLEISKCLKQQWKQMFNKATADLVARQP